MEVGNVKLYCKGKYIKGVSFSKAITSCLLLAIPGVLLLVPTSFVLGPIYLQYPLYILVFSLLVISIIIIIAAAMMDPGILPGREIQEYYLNKLHDIIVKKQRILYSGKAQYQKQFQQEKDGKVELSKKIVEDNNQLKELKLSLKPPVPTPNTDINAFIEQDPRNIFKKSRCYQILNSNHKAETPLKYLQNGFSFTAKYCVTCRFYRPMRSSHSSKSNVCIQRYDHFCQWIGTDVGLHNHGMFHLMLIFISIYSWVGIAFAIICLIMSIFIPIFCDYQELFYNCSDISDYSFVQLHVVLNFISLVLSLVEIGGFIYTLVSITDLIQYHKALLETGSLTKEDSGGNNMSVSAIYSLGSVKQNWKIAYAGMKEPRVLNKFILEQENLLDLAQSNQFITSFDALGRILRMNGIFGFDNLQVVVEENQKSKLNFSMRFGVIDLKKDEQEDQEQQKIQENIDFKQVVCARDAFEYALKRARTMVQLTNQQYITLQKEHPELFAEKPPRKELLMVKMCEKKAEKKGDEKMEPAVKATMKNQPLFDIQPTLQVATNVGTDGVMATKKVKVGIQVQKK